MRVSMNTTETYWSVDGVSLNTYAWNIDTLGGGREQPPKTRGDNYTVPYRTGTIYVPKDVDSRTITLTMWVQGSTQNGDIPAIGADSTFRKNWRSLVNLLWRAGEVFTLTKRFWVGVDEMQGVDLSGFTVKGDQVLIEASASVTYIDGLSPTMTGSSRATFTVDLLLLDAYFYSTKVWSYNLTKSGSIHVPGDATTTNVTVKLKGSTLNPLSISSDTGVALRYTNPLKTTDLVTLSVNSFELVGGSEKYLEYDQYLWFPLPVGTSNLSILGLSTSGSVEISFRAAYL